MPPVPPRVVEAAPAPISGARTRRRSAAGKANPGREAPSRGREPGDRTTRRAEGGSQAAGTRTAGRRTAAERAAAGRPAPFIRTPATADAAEAERQIRDIIEAKNGLSSVDFEGLSGNRRRHNEAKDFIEAPRRQSGPRISSWPRSSQRRPRSSPTSYREARVNTSFQFQLPSFQPSFNAIAGRLTWQFGLPSDRSWTWKSTAPK